jgi:septal ring factor EnvC (AmiA/AmiB activator)
VASLWIFCDLLTVLLFLLFVLARPLLLFVCTCSSSSPPSASSSWCCCSRTTVTALETEKREILQEASNLNVELGIQLNEVKNLRSDLENSAKDKQELEQQLAHIRSSLGEGHANIQGLE